MDSIIFGPAAFNSQVRQCAGALSNVFRRRNLRVLAAKLGCQPLLSQFRHKDRIFGLDLLLESAGQLKQHTYLENSLKRSLIYGNTWSARGLGKDVIHTHEPENLRAVYCRQFNDFVITDARVKHFSTLLGSSVFSTNGAEWKHSRAMLRPAFAIDRAADVDIFERHVQKMIKLIPADGQSVVDLQDLFFRFTMDLGTDIFFGESLNSLQDDVRKDSDARRFEEAYEAAKKHCVRNTQLHPMYWLRSQKGFKEAVVTVQDFMDRFVERALDRRQLLKDSEAQSETFLDEWAKLTSDKVKLRSELLSVLLAARDTTAALLGNLFFVLARRPDVWEKMSSEIQFLQGERPTYEQLKLLKYTKWCMNESLRLHPQVPVHVRTASKDTVLPVGGGKDGKSPILVPAGTAVVMNTYCLHRREDIWGEDAQVFRPERWAASPLDWSFIPFSGGPRRCLGADMAISEAVYITVRLLQHFKEIKAGDAEAWQEDLAVTCSNLHGARVILTPADVDASAGVDSAPITLKGGLECLEVEYPETCLSA
ncbi:cytochrome P450 [Rhizodiscina lignyota]|uniref:Cytochrome P450 n=1 Tax=Rhizodiscina lignyota TaxID=1504668 RepID=A0A9P4M485_9PEZI|nr:cytochrome P450 [Rhizodiscina lignyota]